MCGYFNLGLGNTYCGADAEAGLRLRAGADARAVRAARAAPTPHEAGCALKRPVLTVCTSCRTDEAWDGESFFRALKRARKERGLKPLFKLKQTRCLGGCDTPCNAQLKGKGRPTLELTWLHGEDDVEALLDGAVRFSEAEGTAHPRRPEAPRTARRGAQPVTSVTRFAGGSPSRAPSCA